MYAANSPKVSFSERKIGEFGNYDLSFVTDDGGNNCAPASYDYPYLAINFR